SSVRSLFDGLNDRHSTGPFGGAGHPINLIPHELTCELPNRVIIPPHAGDGRTAVIWPASLVKSRRRLEAANLVLPHQLNIRRRRASRRLCLSKADRLAFVWLYRLCPSVVDAVAIIRPETVISLTSTGISGPSGVTMRLARTCR